MKFKLSNGRSYCKDNLAVLCWHGKTPVHSPYIVYSTSVPPTHLRARNEQKKSGPIISRFATRAGTQRIQNGVECLTESTGGAPRISEAKAADRPGWSLSRGNESRRLSPEISALIEIYFVEGASSGKKRSGPMAADRIRFGLAHIFPFEIPRV